MSGARERWERAAKRYQAALNYPWKERGNYRRSVTRLRRATAVLVARSRALSCHDDPRL